jgi:Flp pilus assembly protein TadG
MATNVVTMVKSARFNPGISFPNSFPLGQFMTSFKLYSQACDAEAMHSSHGQAARNNSQEKMPAEWPSLHTNCTAYAPTVSTCSKSSELSGAARTTWGSGNKPIFA